MKVQGWAHTTPENKPVELLNVSHARLVVLPIITVENLPFLKTISGCYTVRGSVIRMIEREDVRA